MLSNRFFPYSSMQEINLDWILTKIKNILRFVPDDGAVGQILRRTPHGAEWSDEQGAGGSVTSVNGMQGAVVLTASDVGALPDTYAAPVDSVNGQTGAVVLSIPSDTSDLTNTAGFVDAAGAAAAAPVQSVNGQTGTVVLGKSDVGLGNVDNVQQYSASNPPPYPVTSVNGQTGAVTIPSPSKYIVETGTANGWDYDLYNDDTVIATRMMSATMTNYTTFGGFAGYYFASVSTPFTMASGYYVGSDWSIGAGFALPAGRLLITGDSFNVYALSTQSGSASVILRMTLIGKKAV